MPTKLLIQYFFHYYLYNISLILDISTQFDVYNDGKYYQQLTRTFGDQIVGNILTINKIKDFHVVFDKHKLKTN